MLSVKNLESGYGNKQVLFGVSIEVRNGEIVALIGPNGSGKSTLLRTIFGIIKARKGEVTFFNSSIRNQLPKRNLEHGISMVTQENRVFENISVYENLEIGCIQLSRKDVRLRVDSAFDLFPILKERSKQKAGTLSVGEQQVLAIARTLMTNPKLLLLDEPSLGLSPSHAAEVFQKIFEINQDKSVSVLIVEQKVREVLKLSNRVYALKLGRVAWEGDSKDLSLDNTVLKNVFL